MLNICNCSNGYIPYILNGDCRYCYGKNPKNGNNIFYNNKNYKILTNKNT